MDVATYKARVTEAFDRSASRYDQLGVDFFTPMGRRLVHLADVRPGHDVLDVGCGRGVCLFAAAERVGLEGSALGIDIAPGMIDEVRAEITRLGLGNVEAMVLDGEDPGLPARSLDRIVASYSLIFLPDVHAALGRYAETLRPGGKLAFNSPVFSAGTFPFLPPMFTPLISADLLEHLPPEWHPEQLQQRFNSWLEDPADVVAALRKAGFGTVTVVDEMVAMTTGSGEQWVEWSHTQGMRLLWQHLPDSAAADLRARLVSALNALRGADGRISIDVPVRFVVAARDEAQD